jgi:type II secretory pathway component PulC
VRAPKAYIAPSSLDSLGRYLRPIALTSPRGQQQEAELFVRDDYYVQPTQGERRTSEPSAASGPSRPRWVVSAILLTDAQRMAVVNDSVVVVGSTLPGGARIIEIESDRVVLQESGGARRVVSLNR